MASRYLYGDTYPVLLPLSTTQAMAIGDLVSQVGGTAVRAQDTVWASAVATPSAPTVSDSAVSAGTGLANSATGVKVSFNFPWGEGALSAAGTATPTLNASIIVAAITLTSPAISINYYVETSAGSGTYKLYAVGFGQALLITGYGGGRVPPSGALSGALQVTQYNFAAVFAGVSGQANNLTGFFAQGKPYGNSANVVRVTPTSTWEFDCASASFAVGDLVGPAKDTGNALLNQTVVAVTDPTLAIGRVAEATTSQIRVRVRVMSRLVPVAW